MRASNSGTFLSSLFFLSVACASGTSAGCGGGGGGGDTVYGTNGSNYCPVPEAIYGYAYVPIPGAARGLLPPETVADPTGVSDIILTASAIPPVGFEALRSAPVVIVGTTVNVRTGDGGLFSIAGLPPGGYTLEISAEGRQPLRFATTVCTNRNTFVDVTPGTVIYVPAPYPVPQPGGGDGGDSGHGGSSNDGGGSTNGDDGSSSSGGDDSTSSFNRRLSPKTRDAPARTPVRPKKNQGSLGPGRGAVR